jgi:hypothetical protein
MGLVPHPLVRPTPTPQRHQAWHGMGFGYSRFVRHYSGNPLSSSGY